MKIFKVRISDIISFRRLDVSFYMNRPILPSLVSLSSYANIKGGKRIPKGDSFAFEKTDYLYLRLSDITNLDSIDYDNLKCINEGLYHKLHRYEVTENDIIISIAGTIGKCFTLKNIPQNKHIILTENCACLRLKDNAKGKILPDYILILLKTSFVQKQIYAHKIQTTIPKIGLDRIGRLEVIFPSIDTQQKIVDIYTAAQNAKLQKDKEAKELLESIDNIVTQHLGIKLPEKINFSETKYFTPISKLIGQRYDPYFHNPYFERAFAELAQSKYPLKKLGDISILITSGITPKAGGDAYTDSQNGIAFIRSGDIDINGNINFEELLYIKPDVHNKQMKSSKVYDNDIMIAIVGATIGQVGIYHSEKEANINQAIALVRLKDGYNPEYVKELIKSSIGQLNLDRLKRPVARANINLEEIASILIPIPEKIEMQTAIAKEIHEIRVKADAIKNEGSLIIEKAKATIEKMILG